MKSRILELQTLVNNGACAEQVKLFREKQPAFAIRSKIDYSEDVPPRPRPRS